MCWQTSPESDESNTRVQAGIFYSRASEPFLYYIQPTTGGLISGGGGAGREIYLSSVFSANFSVE